MFVIDENGVGGSQLDSRRKKKKKSKQAAEYVAFVSNDNVEFRLPWSIARKCGVLQDLEDDSLVSPLSFYYHNTTSRVLKTVLRFIAKPDFAARQR